MYKPTSSFQCLLIEEASICPLLKQCPEKNFSEDTISREKQRRVKETKIMGGNSYCVIERKEGKTVEVPGVWKRQ